MKKSLLLFTLFIFSLSTAQQINIKIKDQLNRPVGNINVQLLKNNNTIEFIKSNGEGVAKFNIPENGIYTIKLTSVYYKTEVIEIDTHSKKTLEIILTSLITEIESVEIKSRPKIALAKGDTIAFNIKAIKDGTERTAEDLIKKIPGLNINENGKVSYMGNNIGQVLIDGNEFFGSNHKMATQNITAEMLESVDLWQNYTTVTGNRSTALNLKLKDKYKGKITGNIEANYGTYNNFSGHSNLFKFSSLGNLALILDANNIAKDPISFMDFYEMNTQNQIDNAAESTTNIDIPTFLNNDGKVKSKNNQFSALQFSKTSKKYSLTAYSILNAAQLKKANFTERIAFLNQPENYNFFENRIENNKGIFGTTQIKARYNISESTFLYYNLIYTPTNDLFNQNINRTFSNIYNTTSIKDNLRQYSFSNYLSFNIQLDKNTKGIFDLRQNKTSLSEGLNFNSNVALFGYNFNSLKQNFILDTNQYSANFYLKNKNKILNFNFQTGLTYTENESEIENNSINVNNEQKIHSYNYITSFNLNKQIKNWSLSTSLDWHYLMINKKNVNYFVKKIKLKFSPNTKTSQEYSFEYKDNYESPTLKLLQNSPLFDKNISYSVNSTLLSDQLSHYNSFKLKYHRFNLNKGNIWLIMLLYENTSNIFTTNSINYGTYNIYQNIFDNLKERWLGLISNETRFTSYLTLKTKITAMKNNTDNFIQNNQNTSKIQNIEINQQLSTNFKKFPIQFDFGYVYTKNSFVQSVYETKSNQENLRILSGAKTNINKEFIISILGEYLIQKTEIQTLKNYLLSGNITYKKVDSPIELTIKYNNLLNLNNFNYISNRVTQMGTEYTNLIALRGYIIGGIKFYF
ncbi:hypothetical protein [Elizabethkingia meningoseptica]|uniref:hypothetical protein n=1 Tax=Elizabethkingia meningoseptica TaxID=238 RepID=UPI00389285D5